MSRKHAMMAIAAAMESAMSASPIFGVLDYELPAKGPTPNKYTPHQGNREKARRLRQMAKQKSNPETKP